MTHSHIRYALRAAQFAGACLLIGSALAGPPAKTFTSKTPNVLYDYKYRRFYEIPAALTDTSKYHEALESARDGKYWEPGSEVRLIPISNVLSAPNGTRPIVYVADVNTSLAKVEVKGAVTKETDNSGLELLQSLLKSIGGGSFGADVLQSGLVNQKVNGSNLKQTLAHHTALLSLLANIAAQVGAQGSTTLGSVHFPSDPPLNILVTKEALTQLGLKPADLVGLGFYREAPAELSDQDKPMALWLKAIDGYLDSLTGTIITQLTGEPLKDYVVRDIGRQNSAAKKIIQTSLGIVKELSGYVGSERGTTFFDQFVAKSGSDLKSAGDEYTITVSVSPKKDVEGSEKVAERTDDLVLESDSESSFFASVVPIAFAPSREYKFMQVLDDDDNPIGQTSKRGSTDALPNAGLAFTYLLPKGRELFHFGRDIRQGFCFGFAAPYEGFKDVSIGNVTLFLGLHFQKGDYGLIVGAADVRDKVLNGSSLNSDGGFVTKFDHRWTWFVGFSIKANLFGSLGIGKGKN